MLSTGKDFEYIMSEYDIPRLKALNAYNIRTPPTHIGVQRLCRILEAFAGIDSDLPADHSDDEDDLFSDLRNFPQGG